MASASQLTQGNLLPFRLYDEHSVINWYALQGTGLNGQFVALVTGNQDPSTSMGGYSQGNGAIANPAVGAVYTNVISYRYLNFRTVRPAVSGDNMFNVLGVTLHTTANTDENGNPLVNLPYDRVTERGFVLSGFSTPILANGVITLKSNMINGTPIPGYVACVTSGGAAGSVDVVNPTSLFVNTGLFALAASPANVYNPFTVVGKFLSSSGSAFGGYAQLKVTL